MGLIRVWDFIAHRRGLRKSGLDRCGEARGPSSTPRAEDGLLTQFDSLLNGLCPGSTRLVVQERKLSPRINAPYKTRAIELYTLFAGRPSRVLSSLSVMVQKPEWNNLPPQGIRHRCPPLCQRENQLFGTEVAHRVYCYREERMNKSAYRLASYLMWCSALGSQDTAVV